MWIIFFILVGVFVVAAMAVTFLALMKEPHSEELAADLPKSLHEVNPAEVECDAERTEQEVEVA